MFLSARRYHGGWPRTVSTSFFAGRTRLRKHTSETQTEDCGLITCFSSNINPGPQRRGTGASSSWFGKIAKTGGTGRGAGERAVGVDFFDREGNGAALRGYGQGSDCEKQSGDNTRQSHPPATTDAPIGRRRTDFCEDGPWAVAVRKNRSS